MTKKKKIWIVVGVVVVLAIVVVVNLGKSGGISYTVQAEKVKRGEIVAIVTATGMVQAKTTVKVSADVSAKIMELPIEEGDKVKQGDLLVKLDQTRYLAAVRQSEASLAAARATEKKGEAGLLQAKQDYRRAKKLFDRELISEEHYIQIETAREVADANYESAKYYVKQQKAALEQVRDSFSKTVITSPIDGTITELNAEEGEIVMVGTMNNPGTVILTVADLNTIEVEVEVDETDIAQVKVGQKAEIEVDAFPDTTFRGEVTEVGNAAKISGYSSADRVTNFLVKVLLLDDVPDIKPGMTATADITTDIRDDALYLPIQAVVFREKEKEKEPTVDQPDEAEGGAIAAELDSTVAVDDDEDEEELEGVFRIVEDTVIFVPVVTGIADQQNIEIIEGIADGDEIVTGSYTVLRTIETGAQVTVERDKKKSGRDK